MAKRSEVSIPQRREAVLPLVRGKNRPPRLRDGLVFQSRLSIGGVMSSWPVARRRFHAAREMGSSNESKRWRARSRSVLR